MKKLVAGFLMAVVFGFGAPAFADEGGGNGVWNATRGVVSTIFTGAHGVLHVAKAIVDTGMKVVHAGLDALEIPFSNGN